MDVSQHRSTALTDHDANEADLIVAMEHAQIKELRRRYPSACRKICLLPLFSKHDDTVMKRMMIDDPYGRSRDQFEQCYEHVAQSILGLIEPIVAARSK